MSRILALSLALVAIGAAVFLLVRPSDEPAPTEAPGPTEPVPVSPPTAEGRLLDRVAGLVIPEAEAIYVLRGVAPLLERTGLGPLLDRPALAALRLAAVTDLPFDPTRPDAMRSAGLDPDGAWVASIDADGRLLGWLPVVDAAKGAETVRRWAERAFDGLRTDAAIPDAWATDTGVEELVLFTRDGRVGLLWPGTLQDVAGVVGGARDTAARWTERLAPLVPHEPDGALVVAWSADLDGQPPLELERTGDPETDLWLALAENAANTTSFYGEGDSLVSVAAAGNGLLLATSSQVKDAARARELMGAACDVDAVWEALGPGGLRVAGAARAEDLVPITRMMRTLAVAPFGEALATFDRAWEEAALGPAMWGDDGRLRCLLASMDARQARIVVGAEIGAGQRDGVDRLLRALADTVGGPPLDPPRTDGDAATWALGADLGCRYAGKVLVCGAEEELPKVVEGAAQARGRRAVLRVEADLSRLGALFLERAGGAAPPELAPLLAALGTLRYEEVIDGGIAHIRLSVGGGEEPVLAAVADALLF